MAQWSQQQAQELLARGLITEDTYRQMMGDSVAPYTPAGGSTPDPRMDPSLQMSGGGNATGLEMAPPPPRNPGVSMTPVGQPTNADPFGLNAAMGNPPPVVPTLPAQSAAPPADPFGLSTPQAVPAPTSAPPQSLQNIPAPQPTVTLRPQAQNILAPAARPSFSQADVETIKGGPTSDPRVNRAFSQYQKEAAGVREASARTVEAGQKVLDAEMAANARQAENQRRFVETVDAMQTQSDKDWADYQAASNAQLQNIRLAADQAAAARVDPERYWKEKGTAGTIAGVVGIALGALGSAMARTPNFALQMVDNAIARDIAAQEKDLDQNWKKVDSERGLLGDLRNIYGDKRIARADAYKRAYDRTIAMGDQIAAESKNPVAQAKWDETRAALDEKRAAHEFDVLQGLKARQAQMDAAAAAQARAVEAERRKFLEGEFKETLKSARAELQDAAQNGRVPAPWAVETLNRANQAGIPTVTGEVSPAGGTGTNPLSVVPKDQRQAAIKEREDRAKAESAIEDIAKKFQEWRKAPAFQASNLIPVYGQYESIQQNRRLASIKSGLAGAVKSGAGPGTSSDKDFDVFISPNLPAVGDSEETLKMKEKNISDYLRSKSPTPTLDQYRVARPGGAPSPSQTTDTSGFTGVKK